MEMLETDWFDSFPPKIIRYGNLRCYNSKPDKLNIWLDAVIRKNLHLRYSCFSLSCHYTDSFVGNIGCWLVSLWSLHVFVLICIVSIINRISLKIALAWLRLLCWQCSCDIWSCLYLMSHLIHNPMFSVWKLCMSWLNPLFFGRKTRAHSCDLAFSFGWIDYSWLIRSSNQRSHQSFNWLS